MPFKVERDEDLDLTRLTLSGLVGLDLLIEALRAAVAVPGYSARLLIIYEANAELALTSEEVRTLAAQVREERPPGPGRSAVVAPDAVAYGLTRMYQVFSDDIPSDLQVFRTVEDAIDWLGALPSRPEC